jgi:hypothetical protein
MANIDSAGANNSNESDKVSGIHRINDRINEGQNNGAGKRTPPEFDVTMDRMREMVTRALVEPPQSNLQVSADDSRNTPPGVDMLEASPKKGMPRVFQRMADALDPAFLGDKSDFTPKQWEDIQRLRANAKKLSE